MTHNDDERRSECASVIEEPRVHDSAEIVQTVVKDSAFCSTDSARSTKHQLCPARRCKR